MLVLVLINELGDTRPQEQPHVLLDALPHRRHKMWVLVTGFKKAATEAPQEFSGPFVQLPASAEPIVIDIPWESESVTWAKKRHRWWSRTAHTVSDYRGASGRSIADGRWRALEVQSGYTGSIPRRGQEGRSTLYSAFGSPSCRAILST